jgi:hypothetical protein
VSLPVVSGAVGNRDQHRAPVRAHFGQSGARDLWPSQMLEHLGAQHKIEAFFAEIISDQVVEAALCLRNELGRARERAARVIKCEHALDRNRAVFANAIKDGAEKMPAPASDINDGGSGVRNRDPCHFNVKRESLRSEILR